MISASKKTHGKTNTQEYRVWCIIKTRCYNPNRRDYKWYGGKGIAMCDRWMNGEMGVTGFGCFLNDMGERPTKKHTVERRDTKKNYEPDNCYWLLAPEQQRNKSSNVRVEYMGRVMCIAEAARLSGINQHTLAQRVRMNWKPEDFFLPADRCMRKYKHKKITRTKGGPEQGRMGVGSRDPQQPLL